MSSANPFRKKGGAQQPESRFPPIDPIDTSTSSSPSPRPPPTTTFRRISAEGGGDNTDAEEAGPPVPAEKKKKPKVVKKVRVLSPPPLSPDTPEWTYDAPPQIPPHALTSYSSFSSSSEDPFNNNVAGEDSDLGSSAAPTPPPQQLQLQQPSQGGFGQPRANPFSKTLQDIEGTKKHEDLIEERREEGAALKAGNGTSGSGGSALDVNAFKRLLMTGHTGEGEVSTSSEATKAALRISRDIEATRPTSAHEDDQSKVDEGDQSDSSVSVQKGVRKKAPPPPPSSRHGKSIKTGEPREPSDIEPHDATLQRIASDSKPLPPEPVRASSSEGESTPSIPHDARVSKVGEAEGAASVSGGKKNIPAPPPRRGHARGESKVIPPTVPPKDDEAPPRSSTDSTLARSNSSRQPGAPLPPPPRRPQASHRPASLQPSPTSATFNIIPSTPHASHPHPDSVISTPTLEQGAPFEQPTSGHSLPSPPTYVKLSAPPPPPARNTSVRRPPSVHSPEGSSRNMSSGETKNRDSILPPPPPPARKRGGSKSSVEGSSQRTSMEGGGSGRLAGQGATESTEPGHGDTILADLDALKREVDALRGKLR